MNFITKVNNSLLFILAGGVPFFRTFTSGYLKLIDFQYLYIFLIAYYLLLVVVQRKFKAEKAGKLMLYSTIFFLVQVLSGLFSFDIDLAFQKVLAELQFLIILLVANKMILNNDSFEWIFKGLALGLWVSAVIAIFQFLGYKQFYLFSQAELNANAGSFTEHKTEVTRIWGPFGNSLTFSEYLSVAGLAVYSYCRSLKRSLLLAMITLIMVLGCIFLTAGRTALFGTIFSFLLIEFFYAKGNTSRKFIGVIVLGALLTFALLLMLPGIQDNGSPLMHRFSNVSQDLKEGRLNLWVKGYQAFIEDVFLGVGPGNLHMALSAKGFPMTSEVIQQFDGQHVENYYLTVLYTYGIIGFFLCIGIYYYLVKYSYKLFELLKGRVNSLAYGGLMLGSVIALMINNVTDPALIFDQRIKLLFIFVIVVVNNSFFIFDRISFFKQSELLRNIFTRR